MKLRWALALLLMTGGCVSVPSAPVSSVDSPPRVETAAMAQENSAASAIVAPASGGGLDEVDVADGLGDDEIVDPETLEDNQLLTDAALIPPEDEGMSVRRAEVRFDFPVVENAKVRYFLDYYTGPGKRTFARWLERSGRYIPMMRSIFAEEGLPQDLAYLAMVESGFNPRAYSWAHAVGPWQFIESTGKMFGLGNDWWRDERRDFEKSTRAAARFLKDLHHRFDDWYLAVASYNAGPGKISRAIRKYGTRDFWELTRGTYLQTETKNYVPKLLATLLIARDPEKYGFTDLDYHPPLVYDVVEIPTTTDLEVVADLCNVSYDEIKDLNPELKRWCTPPGATNYPVRLPVGAAEGFSEKYARIPQGDRANYQRHTIRQGDTLLALAKRYGIRVDDIVALNGISNPRGLRIGSDLILPLKKGFTSLPKDELRDDYVRTRRQTYTVRQGDSLWKISQRFGVNEKQLRVWNRLGWSNVIRPGQKLIVSASGGQTAGGGKGTASSQRKIVYKVRPGDTLWDIGRQYNVQTRQIMDWNKLSRDHILRPGDKLTLLVGDGRKG